MVPNEGYSEGSKLHFDTGMCASLQEPVILVGRMTVNCQPFEGENLQLGSLSPCATWGRTTESFPGVIFEGSGRQNCKAWLHAYV